MHDIIRKAHADLAAQLIAKAGESGPEFQRSFIEGTLSAIAAHLVRNEGPRVAYATFQKLADECSRSLLDESRA